MKPFEAAVRRLSLKGRIPSTAAIGLGLFLSLNGTISARSELLTFDDLSGQYTAIPNGYGGLDWSDWWVLNVPDYCLSYCPSGYQQSDVSTPNVANGGNPDEEDPGTATFSSSSAFTLNSFYITAGWRDDLTVTVTGYNGAAQIDQTSLTIGTQSASFEVFDWTGLTSVTLAMSGGVPHGYATGSNYAVAIDNMTINGSVTPEPATWMMMLAGFAGLGCAGWARGRKRMALRAQRSVHPNALEARPWPGQARP